MATINRPKTESDRSLDQKFTSIDRQDINRFFYSLRMGFIGAFALSVFFYAMNKNSFFVFGAVSGFLMGASAAWFEYVYKKLL